MGQGQRDCSTPIPVEGRAEVWLQGELKEGPWFCFRSVPDTEDPTGKDGRTAIGRSREKALG